MLPRVRGREPQPAPLEFLSKDERSTLRSKVQKVIDAAKAGNMDVVRRICDRKVLVSDIGEVPVYEYEHDVNGVGQYRNTALHAAAEGRQDDIAAYLIARGADPCAVNMDGKTPLHLAARSGALFILTSLARCDPSPPIAAPDAKGNTALHLATRLAHNDRVVRYLFECGAPVDAVNGRGETALVLACQANNTVVAAALLQCGANPNIPDTLGRSPLHWAAGCGNIPVLRALLDAGARVRAEDEDGNTALHRAASTTRAAVQVLHVGGGWLDARNKKGETTLHLAAKFGKHDIIEYLSEKGAYMNARTGAGSRAMELARGKAVSHLAKEESLAVANNTTPITWGKFKGSLPAAPLPASHTLTAFEEAEARYRIHRTRLSSPKRKPPS